MSTRDELLEAAERIVRDQGRSSLTVRSLAAATNFGKSTVHEAIGSKADLFAELRRRALTDLLSATDTAPDAEGSDTSAGIEGAAARACEWVLINPEWALIALASPETIRNTCDPDEAPLHTLLERAGVDENHHLTDDELGALVRYATALAGAGAQLAIDLGSHSAGRTAFEAVPGLMGAIVEAIESSARDESRPSPAASSERQEGCGAL